MSSLVQSTLPEYSFARSSTIGATYLQGPHHVAKKSTSTWLDAPSTTVFHSSFDTVFTLPMILLCLRCRRTTAVVLRFRSRATDLLLGRPGRRGVLALDREVRILPCL